jgi:hypothetical protein
MGKRLAPKDMGVLSDMATASIAQTIAGIAFNPIDVIKQRLQARRGGMQHACSAWDCWVGHGVGHF